MIILRQKAFGWFGFGKKKPVQEQQKPEYKCPTISDLPANLQSSLRGVERVWKKPNVQKLLSDLGKAIVAGDTIPFTPYVDQRNVEYVHKNILIPSMEFLGYPKDSLMYPLMWDDCRYDGTLLCYEINTGKFWYIDGNDFNFNEAERIKVLRDFIKNSLTDLEGLDEDDITIDPKDFRQLLKDIKKAFWI